MADLNQTLDTAVDPDTAYRLYVSRELATLRGIASALPYDIRQAAVSLVDEAIGKVWSAPYSGLGALLSQAQGGVALLKSTYQTMLDAQTTASGGTTTTPKPKPKPTYGTKPPTSDGFMVPTDTYPLATAQVVGLSPVGKVVVFGAVGVGVWYAWKHFAKKKRR